VGVVVAAVAPLWLPACLPSLPPQLAGWL